MFLKVYCPVLPLKAEFSLGEEREINEIIVNIQVFDILLLCPHQKALEYYIFVFASYFFVLCIVYHRRKVDLQFIEGQESTFATQKYFIELDI